MTGKYKKVIAVSLAVMLGIADISGLSPVYRVSAEEITEETQETAAQEEVPETETGTYKEQEETETADEEMEETIASEETRYEEETAQPVYEQKEWTFEEEDWIVTVSGTFLSGTECEKKMPGSDAAEGSENILYSAELLFASDEEASVPDGKVSVSVTEAAQKEDVSFHLFTVDGDGNLEECEDAVYTPGSVSFEADGNVIFVIKEEKEEDTQEQVQQGEAETDPEDSEKEKNKESNSEKDQDIYQVDVKKTRYADITVYSSEKDSGAGISGTDIEAPEEGLVVLEAYKIDAEEEEQISVSAKLKDPGTDKRETIEIYSVKEGQETGEKIEEDDLHILQAEETGLAVVMDTGYRSKNIAAEISDNKNSSVIMVNGMMPKEIKAEAEDVSDAIAEEDPEFTSEDGAAVLAAFDISLKEGSGEYQPDKEHPLTVRIEDDRIKAGENISLWHIKDSGEAERIETSKFEDGEVSFTAYGFSVYAVVEAPESMHQYEGDAQTLADIVEDTAMLMSVTRGTANDYYFTGSVNAGTGTLDVNTASSEGAQWFFEKDPDVANGYRIYTVSDGQKQYIKNTDGNKIGLFSEGGSIFIVSQTGTGKFNLKLNGTGKYLQYSNGGGGIRLYDGKGAAGNSSIRLTFMNEEETPDDPYSFDGKTYGLINYSDGINGQAMMNYVSGQGFAAESMIVRTDPMGSGKPLYVTEDSDISMWTFRSVNKDFYTISTETPQGTKYLGVMEGNLLLTDESGAFAMQVIPGTGDNSGKLQVFAEGKVLSFEGNRFTLSQPGPEAKKWLNFVEESDITDDDFVVYSAQKVSVSDTERVTNGTKVIIYTRVWDEETKRYKFYAINHDGSLVRCYESGDSIQWIGSRINTLLWNFTEYYWEGTSEPNYYYDLKNAYSEKFIAPQIGGGQILSDEPIGLNMDGRRYGDYYSTIIAWDNPYYAYAGLGTLEGAIISSSFSEAEDFYFAIVEDPGEVQGLDEIPTLDHTQYGITMKLIDFGNSNARQNSFLGSSAGGAGVPPTQGLLSTDLKEDGYPTAAGGSLRTLFSGAREVNHLFIESTYSGSGYYEYDSTQNFASIRDSNDFVVYKELGTTDVATRPSMKHGQFFPFNDINPNMEASINSQNLYSAELDPLSESDPRKYEQLYLVPKPNYYFGMEIEASFVQTPSGRDAWGHDIIYEFTGDDDFWLYVDGELIIDLGGIHSALPGKVNYCTGEVSVNGVDTTLKDLFVQNYRKRGISEDMIAENIAGIFELNDKGQYVFRDYSTHTMKIFFMERGAGASNLHTRFNLSSVRQGQVMLNKKITGTDKSDYKLAEYPYQIWCQMEEDGDYVLLDNTEESGRPSVTYYNTNIPVKYKASYTPTGGTQEYENVFFLMPGQTAVISIPDETLRYMVKECGVNTQVYDSVSANGQVISGEATADENRKDFCTDAKAVTERQRVSFENHVDPSAKRTLTITKKLYDIDDNLIEDDPAEFSFRLYLGNENDASPAAAALQEYRVKDPDGYYCRWDAGTQKFVSAGKTDVSSMTEEEKRNTAFQTSLNGAISRIPANYRIEVTDLLVGTKFRVEERPNEIPGGYRFIKYERDAASYIVEDGDTVNSGIIRDNDSPAVEIHNRRGFGISAKKEWSDKNFAASHGDVFFAVYVNGDLLDGSIRVIEHPHTSVYYYWDELEEGASLSDYHISEVKLNGSFAVNEETGAVTPDEGTSVEPVPDGGIIQIHAVMKDGTEDDFDYTVTENRGEITGHAHNMRTDVITNSRFGIKIIKEDFGGGPLANAVFTLEDSEGNPAGSGTYTSGNDGLAADAYLNVGEEYALTEIKSPERYHAASGPLKFRIRTSDGKLEVTDGEEGEYSIVQASASEEAKLVIKNRKMKLRAVNVGIDNGAGEALPGSHFSLYKEISVNGTTVPDYDPVPGYEDIVSEDMTGILTDVTENLPRRTYYLKQRSAGEDYDTLSGMIRFTLTETGEVLLDENDNASLSPRIDENGDLEYTLTVINRKAMPVPSGVLQDKRPYIWMLSAGILIMFICLVSRKKAGHVDK